MVKRSLTSALSVLVAAATGVASTVASSFVHVEIASSGRSTTATESTRGCASAGDDGRGLFSDRRRRHRRVVDGSGITKGARCLTMVMSKSSGGNKSTATSTKSSSSPPFANEIGATAPLGFFDPLGLVSDGDQDKFNRLRYVEIKHGRISMLAVVGYLVQESGTRLPGTIDYEGTTFDSIPNGFAALSTMPNAGLWQIVAFIGLLESAVMKDIDNQGEFVGDFRNGFIDFGWNVFTPEEQERKRTIEINQGRAAMMGILSLMVHDQLHVSIIPF